ncbi:hypothetical protein HA402_015817 [Bradysia odoriphaga]|nr:hypothetical protein HA402_015817 [Bradysia odoriphaga]
MLCTKKIAVIASFVILALIFIMYNSSSNSPEARRSDEIPCIIYTSPEIENRHDTLGPSEIQGSYESEDFVPNQILIYTKYYGSEWNDIFTGEPLFKNNRCTYTTDPSDLKRSPLVLFHLRDVTKDSHLPTMKVPNQKWVVYNIESPIVNRKYDAYSFYKKISHQFDIAMTYRLDADIPIPYGSVERRVNSTEVTGEINFKEKSKMIAWFVSNCNSLSKREIVVKKMRRLIPIDVYGHCGSLKCPIVDERTYKNESCYEMLSKSYKFYLAFENSICVDYVTEKLYNILNYDIIPIVYGGANYSNLLPYNSYIDVMNFTSPEKLVNYLQYVGSNESVYKSYFHWRKDFQVVSRFPDKLCDFLLNNESMAAVTKRNFFDWWFQDSCRETTIW